MVSVLGGGGAGFSSGTALSAADAAGAGSDTGAVAAGAVVATGSPVGAGGGWVPPQAASSSGAHTATIRLNVMGVSLGRCSVASLDGASQHKNEAAVSAAG